MAFDDENVEKEWRREIDDNGWCTCGIPHTHPLRERGSGMEVLNSSNFQKYYNGNGCPKPVSMSEAKKFMIDIEKELAHKVPELLGWKKKHKGDFGSKESDFAKLYTMEAKVSGMKRGKGVYADNEQPLHRVLNMALAHDDDALIKAFLPFIRGCNYYLNQTRHEGGIYWRGVNMGKTQNRYIKGEIIRLASFTSVSKSRDTAKGFGKQLLQISIPKNFWGARHIEQISIFANEQETLFVAWQAFKVMKSAHKAKDGTIEVHLRAIDKYCGIKYDKYYDDYN